jgi:hypothetical protein
VQVALDLIQDILRGAAEQDSACLGVLAFCEVGEVLVAKFGNLEQTALCTDIRRGRSEDRVDNGGTGGSCDTVVVRLADAANGCDVGLDEVVLGKIYLTLVVPCTVHKKELTANTLLRDDKIGLQSNDGIAHSLDLLLLDLQYPVPVLLFADLDVCLTLALLVFERAIQQQNLGVLDPSPHLRVCDILVDHDAVQNLAVLNLASGNLLNAGITLDVDLLLASHLSGHCANSLECKTAHQLRPP